MSFFKANECEKCRYLLLQQVETSRQLGAQHVFVYIHKLQDYASRDLLTMYEMRCVHSLLLHYYRLSVTLPLLLNCPSLRRLLLTAGDKATVEDDLQVPSLCFFITHSPSLQLKTVYIEQEIDTVTLHLRL